MPCHHASCSMRILFDESLRNAIQRHNAASLEAAYRCSIYRRFGPRLSASRFTRHYSNSVGGRARLRIVVSKDTNTLIGHHLAFVRLGNTTPGLLILRRRVGVWRVGVWKPSLEKSHTTCLQNSTHLVITSSRNDVCLFSDDDSSLPSRAGKRRAPRVLINQFFASTSPWFKVQSLPPSCIRVDSLNRVVIIAGRLLRRGR